MPKELMGVAEFSARYLNNGAHKGGRRYQALLDGVTKYHTYKSGGERKTFEDMSKACEDIYHKAVDMLTGAKQKTDPERTKVLLEIARQAQNESKYMGRRMHMGLSLSTPAPDAKSMYKSGVGQGFKEPKAQAPGSATTRLTRGNVKNTDGFKEGNYWLEAYDAKHRPGFLLHTEWTKWALDPSLSYATSFWDYLASVEAQTGPVSKFIRDPTGMRVEQNVRYLKTEAERQPYLLTFERGLLRDHNGDAYDTSRETTVASGKGWAIFVVDERDNFYAGTHLLGVFHHSSFLGGAPTRAAGELVVEQGKLMAITSKSGHYKPGPGEMLRALTALVGQGAVTDKVPAVVYPDLMDPENRWFGAFEYQEAQGKEHKLNNPPLTRDQVLKAIPVFAERPKLSWLPKK